MAGFLRSGAGPSVAENEFMVDVVVGQVAVGFGERQDLAPGLLEAEDD